MILSTEEDTVRKLRKLSERDHWRSDYNHFQSYLSHYISDLRHWRSDHMLLNNYLSHYKRWSWLQTNWCQPLKLLQKLSHPSRKGSRPRKKRVITSFLINISTTTKVILVTNKLMLSTDATLKVIWAATKVTLVTGDFGHKQTELGH